MLHNAVPTRPIWVGTEASGDLVVKVAPELKCRRTADHIHDGKHNTLWGLGVLPRFLASLGLTTRQLTDQRLTNPMHC